jgi:hypothetical protein
MHDAGWVHIGDMLESARYSAKKDWRDDYAPGTPIAELFAAHVRTVELRFEEFPAGRAEIIVRISAIKASKTETFFYKMQREAGVWYQLSGM